MTGNERFTHHQLTSVEHDLRMLKENTVEKQEPFAVVLACADSRVSGLAGSRYIAPLDARGLCQEPWGAISASASGGPQVPGSYGRTGGGSTRIGSMMRQDASTSS